MEKSLKFYQEVLGFHIYKRAIEEDKFMEELSGIKGVKLEWVKLLTSDAKLLELLHYHIPKTQGEGFIPNGRTFVGCSHIALTIQNLDIKIKKFREAGFISNDPVISPDGKVKLVYGHEPGGTIIEFVEELR